MCAAGESSCNPCETWVDFPDNCLDREDKIIADDPLAALGVRLAWRYLQGEGIAPQPDPRQPEQLRLGTTTLPPLAPNAGSYVQADTRGYQMLLDYQGLKPHPAFVSLTAVLSDTIDPHVFKEKYDLGPVPPQVLGAPPPTRISVGALRYCADRVRAHQERQKVLQNC